jgi:hypothetical protein
MRMDWPRADEEAGAVGAGDVAPGDGAGGGDLLVGREAFFVPSSETEKSSCSA